MNPLSVPKINDRFPSCIALKLHFIESQLVSSLPEIEVNLTLQFSGEQELDLPASKLDAVLQKLGVKGGKIKFGICRGKLKLKLVNCKMPLEKTALYDEFKTSMELEVQEETGSEGQIGWTAGGTLGSNPSATGTGTVGVKLSDKTTQKLKSAAWQVHKTGGEFDPQWQFENKTEQAILRGLLQQELLGAIEGDAMPYDCEATFEASPDDVRLTWGEVMWTKDITRTKLAVIERAIVLKCIKPQLKQPMSEVRWQHG